MTEAPTDTTPRRWTGRRRGGRLGNGFFVLLLRAGGLPLAPFFVAWVALWFVCTSGDARRSSMSLARRLGVDGAVGRLVFAWRHFLGFGLLQVDRMAVLAGLGAKFRYKSTGLAPMRAALAEGKGAVLVATHIGNWELAGQILTDIGAPLALVMYEAETDEARAALDALERERGFRVIRADGSPATAAAILAALRDGCMVGIMGDRLLAGGGAEVELLGETARLPVAPYVVAAQAGAPVFHTYCVRTGLRRYHFIGFEAGVPVLGQRSERAGNLQRAAQSYADHVGQVLREHPHQWGNFHDVWATEDEG